MGQGYKHVPNSMCKKTEKEGQIIMACYKKRNQQGEGER